MTFCMYLAAPMAIPVNIIIAGLNVMATGRHGKDNR